MRASRREFVIVAVLVLQFAGLAVVVALAGMLLARSADAIATATGLGRLLVGSMLLAAATSLPELASSIAAVRIGAVDLAIGNAFGSNAFNMVLFVPLDAVHPGPLFAAVSAAHGATVLAVIVATAIAVLGQLYHVERRVPLCEPDALLILVVVAGALALVYRLS